MVPFIKHKTATRYFSISGISAICMTNWWVITNIQALIYRKEFIAYLVTKDNSKLYSERQIIFILSNNLDTIKKML
jgi:hypothetical protein